MVGLPAKTSALSFLKSFDFCSVDASCWCLLKQIHAVQSLTLKSVLVLRPKTYIPCLLLSTEIIEHDNINRQFLLRAISEVKTKTSQRCTPGKSIFSLTVGRFPGEHIRMYPYPAVAEHPGIRGQSDKAFCHKVSKP